ncbi:MAG TPA: hypothetical protein VGR15_06500 [Bacteroidota bacterium]|nr:hypothetical protein [Bacteroidota bacterium]
MRTMLDNRLAIPAVIVLIFSVIVLQLPLFNYLGYEFSVAVAFLAVALNGFSAIRLFRSEFADRHKISREDFRRVIGKLLREGLLLLLVPFAAATLNMMLVKNCSYWEGALFYLLIPAVTVIWSVALAATCAVFVRRALLLYLVAVIVVLVHPLYLGYTTPQIYSFNFIYGYFPGFSYDEVLRISTPMILFRCLTLVVALFFVLCSRIVILHRTKAERDHMLVPGILALMTCSALILCSWLFRVELGFESSTRFIQRTLGEHYTTEHFDIYYSRESFSDVEIRRVGLEHEFRFDQVRAALRVSWRDRISSYIYPDIDLKRRFIGTGNTNIAKPWRKEIHLNKDSWDDVLKHELVHVLAGEFGMPIIRVHYNTGLVEGLAMAVDGDFGHRTLPEYAAAIMKFNLVRDPARLVKPVGFAAQSSTLSYVMMGAFCRYLIDRYGIIHFKEVYGGKTVEDVYGMPYERLVDEWRHSLERVDVPQSSRRHIEFYFRRPSIFAKECARAIASVNERASRALEQNDAVAAMELFHTGLKMSWNSESYAGLVRAMFGAARYDSVIGLIGIHLQDSIRRSGIVNLFLVYGDALWRTGDTANARHIYAEILSLDLSERYDQSAAVRLSVLNDPSLGSVLPVYFAGLLKDSTAVFLLDSLQRTSPSSTIRYLKARVLFRLHGYDGAVRELDSIRTPFGDDILDAGKEQLLGEACFMKGSYQQARMHFWQSLNFLRNQSSVNRVKDWIERCEWFESNLARSAMAP